MSQPKVNMGSFRDPSGNVIELNGHILRTVNEVARSQYEHLRDNEILKEAIDSGQLIDCTEIPKQDWPTGYSEVAYVVEHPRLPYISYPYEWSFGLLKSAALHHLDFQIDMLARDVSFSDASAYNVQFIGAKPIFIDMLSLSPHRPYEYWKGHRQFCEQFLNPLLLRATLGVTHNAWYRGSQEGNSNAGDRQACSFPKTPFLEHVQPCHPSCQAGRGCNSFP